MNRLFRILCKPALSDFLSVGIKMENGSRKKNETYGLEATGIFNNEKFIFSKLHVSDLIPMITERSY